MDGADTRAATGAENGQKPNDGVCGCRAALVSRLPALEKSIENILKLMVEEASAARDREVRLLRKIGNLEAQLSLLQQQQTQNSRNGCLSLPADSNVSVEKSAENSTRKRKTKHGHSDSPPKTNPVNVVNGVLMDSEPQDHMTTPSEIIFSPPPNTETTVEREWTLVKPKSRYEVLPLAANDESWKLVSDKPQSVRKAALYVGNMRSEVSESELVQFIYSRCEAAGHEKPAEINASLKPVKNSGPVGCTVANGNSARARANPKVNKAVPMQRTVHVQYCMFNFVHNEFMDVLNLFTVF